LEELFQTDWSSLYWDEQQHLKTLGWTESLWDNKHKLSIRNFPETARKDFYDLEAQQKVAAVHLWLMPRDPYWQEFWRKMAGKP
jgi:hypothetical protein